MSNPSSSSVLVVPAILGEVVVWGDDTNHQITERPKVAGFSKVAPGGATQGLVLGAGGLPVLWGGFGLGTPSKPIVPPFTLTVGERYVDIAIGVSFAAAIRRSDGWIETSGVFADDPNKPAALPPSFNGTRFIAVTVGGGHGVGIVEDDGTLLQWGAGEGTAPKPKDFKFPKPQYIKFVQVRARSDYNLALDEHGDLYAWGGDDLFRPDMVSASPHPLAETGWRFVSTQPSGSDAGHIPVQLVPKGYWYHKGPFEAVAAGVKTSANALPHVLALKPDGKVVGWPTSAAAAVAPADVRFSAIAAGRGFSVGLDRAGEPHHWGEPGVTAPNGKGVLENVPKGPFVAIGAGTRHATAVRPGGLPASSVDQ